MFRDSVKITGFLFLSMIVLTFAGCKGKQSSQQAVQKAAPAAKPAEAPAPEEVKVEKEVYNYQVGGRRDPFLSLIVDVKKDKPRIKKLNPVENFDVDEIKLIAIMWDKNKYYAMITLPDGKSYTIRKGMTLGLYGGKVEEITKNSLLLREQVKDYKGQPKTKDTILKLRKEGEE